MNKNSINTFSLPVLLKSKKIMEVNDHCFEINNFGNVKIELFASILSNYLILINKFLAREITEKDKLELLKNSGFYKLENKYVLLANIDEKDEECFYLKNNLGCTKITSLNKDIIKI